MGEEMKTFLFRCLFFPFLLLEWESSNTIARFHNEHYPNDRIKWAWWRGEWVYLDR